MFTNKWLVGIGIMILISALIACTDTLDENDLSEGPIQEQEESNDEIEDHSNEDEDMNNEPADTNNESDEGSNQKSEETPSQTINILKDSSITALVNKYNSLGENYAPDDLVTVEVPTVLDNPEVKQLRKEAAEALKAMFGKAEESGIILHARSGYRSYETQVQLFNNYATNHGEEAANRYSARPGHSEHQTGLVMDVTSESVDLQLKDRFGETEEGLWVKENAHKFGFIIRYPKDMEQITGYVYEPWHIRYLGKEIATELYESGRTYEEYLVKEGIIHEVNAEASE